MLLCCAVVHHHHGDVLQQLARQVRTPGATHGLSQVTINGASRNHCQDGILAHETTPLHVLVTTANGKGTQHKQQPVCVAPTAQGCHIQECHIQSMVGRAHQVLVAMCVSVMQLDPVIGRVDHQAAPTGQAHLQRVQAGATTGRPSWQLRMPIGHEVDAGVMYAVCTLSQQDHPVSSLGCCAVQVSGALNPENGEGSKAFQECVLARHPRHGEFAIAFITGRTVLQVRGLGRMAGRAAGWSQCH